MTGRHATLIFALAVAIVAVAVGTTLFKAAARTMEMATLCKSPAGPWQPTQPAAARNLCVSVSSTADTGPGGGIDTSRRAELSGVGRS